MYRTVLLLFSLLLAGYSTPATAAVATPVTPVATPAATETEALEAARAYTESLKEMTAGERRELRREKRAAVKDALRNHQGSDTNTLLLVLITILLPPVGVLIYEGEITSRFWIALLLTLLFYLPGLVYSLLVIFG